MPGLEAFTVAQVFNSIMASLGVGAFYLFSRTFIREQWLSISTALMLGVSNTYWIFATDVEVHAPAFCFYMLSLLIVSRLPTSAEYWKYVLLGLVSAIAILFHIISSDITF